MLLREARDGPSGCSPRPPPWAYSQRRNWRRGEGPIEKVASFSPAVSPDLRCSRRGSSGAPRRPAEVFFRPWNRTFPLAVHPIRTRPGRGILHQCLSQPFIVPPSPGGAFPPSLLSLRSAGFRTPSDPWFFGLQERIRGQKRTEARRGSRTSGYPISRKANQLTRSGPRVRGEGPSDLGAPLSRCSFHTKSGAIKVLRNRKKC
jgi:hypothetical protein